MKEHVRTVLGKEKDFDQIINEIYRVIDHESDQRERRNKIAARFQELKKIYLVAHYDAVTDPLTDCFNKKHISDFFYYQKSFAKRNDQYFSLVALDIDYLKYINDTFGHDIGDRIIKEISDAIKKNIRENDLLFRYGGDEFVLLCIYTEKDGINRIVTRIKKEVNRIKSAKGFKPTITIGCVTSKDKENDITYTAMFKKADKVLYKEKHKRKPPKFFNGDSH
jgi:diguanylate cyclase (GGDEF)-like protein